MSNETPVQPKLSDLLAGYLKRAAHAHDAGLAAFDPGAEVVPFEAGPVQPIDAGVAWKEALAPVGHFVSGFDPLTWKAPPAWSSLVAAHEPVVALSCAVGNFPQLVRHLHTILQTPDLTQLRPIPGRAVSAPTLLDWVRQVEARKDFSHMLLALGTLRLARQFDEAARFVEAHDAAVPGEWRGAWDNEKAALAWHGGDCGKARDLWHAMAPAVPVLFNRGMADLFLGRATLARSALTEAVAKLPEDGAWHHLGRLYLTLAAGRE